MKTTGYVNQVIALLEKKIEDSIDGLMKQIGEQPGQVAITRVRQMKAYQELTAPDLAELEKMHGRQKVGAYIYEMERRRRGDGRTRA